jgi:hypothetical protein
MAGKVLAKDWNPFFLVGFLHTRDKVSSGTDLCRSDLKKSTNTTATSSNAASHSRRPGRKSTTSLVGANQHAGHDDRLGVKGGLNFDYRIEKQLESAGFKFT